MEYNQFLTYILTSVQSFMGPDVQVSLHKVLKNNNIQLDGLMILPPGQNISPTIYLNAYYQDFLNGASLSSIVSAVLEVYENAVLSPPAGADLLHSFRDARHRIVYKLIHRQSNQSFLEQVPFLPFLDLAIVFYILVSAETREELTVTITRAHINMWQTTEDALMEAASVNTPLLYRCRCVALEEMVGELMREAAEPDISDSQPAGLLLQPPFQENTSPLPMYILTNHKRLNGAACLLYDHVLETFAEQAGRNFFILPSSIHETILVPHLEYLDREALNNMVREVNQTYVQPWDRLSDHVYYYTADTGSITVC